MLPVKDEFELDARAYLDSASVHPFSRSARRIVEDYARRRTMSPGIAAFDLSGTAERVRTKLAALINAEPEELCLLQSTTAAEHLVLQALHMPLSGGRIVTDALHYPGSLYLYQSMARMGMDVAWLIPDDEGRIDIGDLEVAVSKKTRLVALSMVSTVNGFEHDLKRVCTIAHNHGALVYADIVQAAGAVPVDVRKSNVDFAACASYKWLMGDFGLGALYVRKDLLSRVRRTQFGPFQLRRIQTNFFPFNPPDLADLESRNDATGIFGMGTISGSTLAQLDQSLDYIRQLGVERIRDYRQPLLDRARFELEQRGYRCVTPVDSRSPILTFVYPDVSRLTPRLDAAGVKITLVDNRFRISPSVFNDMGDIESLLAALP